MAKRDDSRYRNPDGDPRGPWLATDLTAPVERPHLIYEFRGHFPPKGRSWKFTAERLQELDRLGAIYVRATGLPFLKRYLADVRNEDIAGGVAPSRVEVIVRAAMRAIAVEVARNPIAISQVEWRDLERVLREVFETLGYDTELTRSGKDGGFDLRLACVESGKPLVFIVEVKHWITRSSRPGYSVISALFDVVASMSNAPTGIVLSSSGFTRQAVHGRSEVEQQRVRLGGREKMASLFQHFINANSGLWVPAEGLPQVLLEGTY